MEKKNNITWIIKQYFTSYQTKETQHLFRKWFLDSKDKSEKDKALADLWESISVQTTDDTLNDLEVLHSKIQEEPQQPRKRIPTSSFIRIAASILIPFICVLATYLITKDTNKSEVNLVECFVGNGDRRLVILPDSTQVWVNSGSLLIYPEVFRGDTRTVYLNGEANFNVTKDEAKRFIVNTGQLSVEALGTTFNVQAYLDMSKTTTILEEGKIKIETKGENPQSVIVSPNEQVIYNHKDQSLTMRKVNAQRIAMWKYGYLIFQGATIDDILHSIEKRYDVVVQYDAGKYAGKTFTVRFLPDETLDETLLILKEIIRDFNYKIKDNSIYIN